MHDDWARHEQANSDITIGCLSLNLTDHCQTNQINKSSHLNDPINMSLIYQ